jgi:hypothetical protein
MQILTHFQADAAYRALRALSGIRDSSGYAGLLFKDAKGALVNVTTSFNDGVLVERGAPKPARRERYATLADFVIAYHLTP